MEWEYIAKDTWLLGEKVRGVIRVGFKAQVSYVPETELWG